VPADDPLPENARVTPSDVEERKLILLEEGHCLRDQALDYCAQARSRVNAGLGATSLATIMQMVACGYGVTLVPGPKCGHRFWRATRWVRKPQQVGERRKPSNR
jgi:LysR family hydrogen peroxide-inducible transcriptional activator